MELSSKEKKLILLGEMFENIVHQLKQPLNSINIEASGIKFQQEMGILDATEINKSLDNIIESVNFLSNTIDDFRNFIQKEKVSEEFNIIDTINSIEKILKPLYKASGVELVNLFKTDSIIIKGFEGELSQVIINILNNARDQLKNQVSLDRKLVLVDIYKENNQTIVSILDNGGGVPEDILPHIFEYKYSTKGDEGTGLGLYMSKEIIKKGFNGEIIAKNKSFEYEGNSYIGANFKIILKDING